MKEVFAAAGVAADIARETVAFDFESVEEVVSEYGNKFGPFVMARGMLEPQGRWEDFLEAFEVLVRRFNASADGGARVESEYFLITVSR